MTKKVGMSVAEARAAWEADKENPETMASFATRVLAATSLGQMTIKEAEELLRPVGDLAKALHAKERAEAVEWATGILGDADKAELARKLFEAGVPNEVAAAAINALGRGVGSGAESGAFVVSVGADGVATVHDLSADENDGIGRTVGNA